ncbi:iron-containing alcohol dehydrogenase [Oceanisphaera arctica]|uniref:NADH-dependent alcohol dehydrogenase n=1 Tax=Oceanisphaera arctica TaxID=641510 RepID=A0A2P5TPN2_9GAMM|nr:iron-containing alcohol dehydrogenase [Oceanisphaera arctica]PPL17572.1 NADH-dependent alcohol dehydrogenase [Oceanisphaera arctica]GHA16138.1 NADH-dependent alcohol dehydrogenase [Oceanisphaera arctica]
MQDFSFYNPTRIEFGAGKIASLNQLVPTDARVLVLFGGESARRTGTLDEVTAALGDREVQLFGGIEPNPSFETLMEAVALVRSNDIDFLLAVGGGSVIDGTKFVAAAALFDGDAWEILKQGGQNIERALPFGTVLTLPATGSEMNKGSVITRKALQAKLPFMSEQVYPLFSVLDPVKTYTLPTRQVANGVVDAFVHVMEQYLTYPAQAPVQDRFAEGLLQTLIEIGPKALAEPEDYQTRASLMWTATLALNGLIGAGVPQDWASHMLGHELTALHNLDHAQTLAVVLPEMLRQRKATKLGKLVQYAERVWDIREGSDDDKAEAAIERTREFFESVGVKTRLGDYGLGAEHIDGIIDSLKNHGMVALGEHGDVTPEHCRQILLASL